MNAQAIIPYQNSIAMPPVPTLDKIMAIKELVKLAAQSGMVKVSGGSIEQKTANAFFIAMYGLELGIPPMTALRTIFSVNGGAPTCSGEAMLALIRRSGKVRITISSTEETLTNQRATVHMKRLDSGDEFTASFGAADTTRAGLSNKDNHKNYPAQMWTWRAVSIAAKALCSDIIGGLYTVEEIYPDTPVDESGAPTADIIEAPATPKATNVTPIRDYSSHDTTRRVPQQEPPQIIITDGTSALAPAPEKSENGTHPPAVSVAEPTPETPATGQPTPEQPTPSENAKNAKDDITAWEFYNPLMAHESVRALYKDGPHRKNVIVKLKAAGAFESKKLSSMVWRIQTYQKLREEGHTEDESASAAAGAPDELEGF